jgi:hypothetical protein
MFAGLNLVITYSTPPLDDFQSAPPTAEKGVIPSVRPKNLPRSLDLIADVKCVGFYRSVWWFCCQWLCRCRRYYSEPLGLGSWDSVYALTNWWYLAMSLWRRCVMDLSKTQVRSSILTLSDPLSLMNPLFLWCIALSFGSKSVDNVLKVNWQCKIVINWCSLYWSFTLLFIHVFTTMVHCQSVRNIQRPFVKIILYLSIL